MVSITAATHALHADRLLHGTRVLFESNLRLIAWTTHAPVGCLVSHSPVSAEQSSHASNGATRLSQGKHRAQASQAGVTMLSTERHEEAGPNAPAQEGGEPCVRSNVAASQPDAANATVHGLEGGLATSRVPAIVCSPSSPNRPATTTAGPAPTVSPGSYSRKRPLSALMEHLDDSMGGNGFACSKGNGCASRGGCTGLHNFSSWPPNSLHQAVQGPSMQVTDAACRHQRSCRDVHDMLLQSNHSLMQGQQQASAEDMRVLVRPPVTTDMGQAAASTEDALPQAVLPRPSRHHSISSGMDVDTAPAAHVSAGEVALSSRTPGDVNAPQSAPKSAAGIGTVTVTTMTTAVNASRSVQVETEAGLVLDTLAQGTSMPVSEHSHDSQPVRQNRHGNAAMVHNADVAGAVLQPESDAVETTDPMTQTAAHAADAHQQQAAGPSVQAMGSDADLHPAEHLPSQLPQTPTPMAGSTVSESVTPAVPGPVLPPTSTLPQPLPNQQSAGTTVTSQGAHAACDATHLTDCQPADGRTVAATVPGLCAYPNGAGPSIGAAAMRIAQHHTQAAAAQPVANTLQHPMQSASTVPAAVTAADMPHHHMNKNGASRPGSQQAMQGAPSHIADGAAAGSSETHTWVPVEKEPPILPGYPVTEARLAQLAAQYSGWTPPGMETDVLPPPQPTPPSAHTLEYCHYPPPGQPAAGFRDAPGAGLAGRMSPLLPQGAPGGVFSAGPSAMDYPGWVVDEGHEPDDDATLLRTFFGNDGGPDHPPAAAAADLAGMEVNTPCSAVALPGHFSGGVALPDPPVVDWLHSPSPYHTPTGLTPPPPPIPTLERMDTAPALHTTSAAMHMGGSTPPLIPRPTTGGAPEDMQLGAPGLGSGSWGRGSGTGPQMPVPPSGVLHDTRASYLHRSASDLTPIRNFTAGTTAGNENGSTEHHIHHELGVPHPQRHQQTGLSQDVGTPGLVTSRPYMPGPHNRSPLTMPPPLYNRRLTRYQSDIASLHSHRHYAQYGEEQQDLHQYGSSAYDDNLRRAPHMPRVGSGGADMQLPPVPRLHLDMSTEHTDAAGMDWETSPLYDVRPAARSTAVHASPGSTTPVTGWASHLQPSPGVQPRLRSEPSLPAAQRQLLAGHSMHRHLSMPAIGSSTPGSHLPIPALTPRILQPAASREVPGRGDVYAPHGSRVQYDELQNHRGGPIKPTEYARYPGMYDPRHPPAQQQHPLQALPELQHTDVHSCASTNNLGRTASTPVARLGGGGMFGDAESPADAARLAAIAVAAATDDGGFMSLLAQGLNSMRPSGSTASQEQDLLARGSASGSKSKQQAKKKQQTSRGRAGPSGTDQGEVMDVDMPKKQRENLPRDSVLVLKQWLYGHISHPYPTESEKAQLTQATGLDMLQLNNWFINARVRIWRPIIVAIFQTHMESMLTAAQARGDELTAEKVREAAQNPNAQLAIILTDEVASEALVAAAQQAADVMMEKEAARAAGKRGKGKQG